MNKLFAETSVDIGLIIEMKADGNYSIDRTNYNHERLQDLWNATVFGDIPYRKKGASPGIPEKARIVVYGPVKSRCHPAVVKRAVQLP